MYQERYPTTLSWVFGTVAGESASLSKALRIGDLGADVVTGEKTLGEASLKVSPLFQFANQMGKKLPEWDFDGR